jgi:hypothetical protein
VCQYTSRCRAWREVPTLGSTLDGRHGGGDFLFCFRSLSSHSLHQRPPSHRSHPTNTPTTTHTHNTTFGPTTNSSAILLVVLTTVSVTLLLLARLTVLAAGIRFCIPPTLIPPVLLPSSYKSWSRGVGLTFHRKCRSTAIPGVNPNTSWRCRQM